MVIHEQLALRIEKKLKYIETCVPKLALKYLFIYLLLLLLKITTETLQLCKRNLSLLHFSIISP